MKTQNSTERSYTMLLGIWNLYVEALITHMTALDMFSRILLNVTLPTSPGLI